MWEGEGAEEGLWGDLLFLQAFHRNRNQNRKPKTETETETPSGMRRTDPDPLAEDTDVNLDSELTRVQLTTTVESLISRALEIACE